MPSSCKGSVVLLAGVLPALFFSSHALPSRQVTRGSGPLPQFSTPAKAPVVVGWIRAPSHHGAAVRSAAAPSRNQQERRQNSMPHGVRASLSPPPSAIAHFRRKRPRRSIIPTLHDATPGVEGGAFPPSAAASVSHVDSTINSAPQRAASTATAGSNSNNKRPGVVEGVDLPSERGELRSKVGASPAAAGRRSRDFFAASAAETPSEASVSATADKEELVDEPDVIAVIDDKGAATCLLLKGIDRVAEVAELRVRLRVATLDDYYAIADVRFDVFSPVHSTLKHRFRERSCLLMTERRRRGAFCLVAVLEGADSAEEGGVTGITEEHVLGTLECSRHEFDGTPLAVKREAEALARLYLTEVAVRSDCRRLGVGSILLDFVDDVAKHLDTAEIFLHVNEVNEAALRLYSRCGYEESPDCASNRAFTNSLGLAGGFIGQRHSLLHKTFD